MTRGILQQWRRKPVAKNRTHHSALYAPFIARHPLGETLHASEAIARAQQITSLRTLVRIVDDGPTFETLNLAGPLAASCPDVVDEPSVSA